MTVRRAASGDIPAIMGLLAQVNRVHAEARPDIFKLTTKYSPSEVAAIIADDRTPLFVGEEDGKVAGYAMCRFIKHKGESLLADIKTLYIDDLCVDEKLRGRHIGTHIYEYVLNFAKQSGCYNLTLNVWACNPAAEAFYKKCGLVPQRTTMEKIL